MSDAAAAPPGVAAAGDRRLDDVLLAMDVVDTLRHREQAVLHELESGTREEQLLVRLKDIYRAQGIEVPDHILRDGVKALGEQRFAYVPPGNSLMVRLARLYVARDKWLRPAALAMAGLAAAFGLYQVGIAGPERERAQDARIELAETLPASLDRLKQDIEASTEEPEALRLAGAIHLDGRRALSAADAGAARNAVTELETLKRDLDQIYEVRVRYQNGAQSGIFRIPESAPDVRNYYLIVEAVDPRGGIVSVPVTNEENQARSRVPVWAQRVSQDVFNRVADDKRDDQIIQNAVIGHKPSGRLSPIYAVDTPGGALTEW